MDELTTVTLIGAGGYAAKKLFDPALQAIGDDIGKAYRKGLDKILLKAARKVENHNDGAQPNLRVTREVLWHGSLSEDEVCAEYFGGILASSRSPDGRDDGVLIYVDCIKALSAKQLHLHYATYRSLDTLVAKTLMPLEPSHDEKLRTRQVHFVAGELYEMQLIGSEPSLNLAALHRMGLIDGYEMKPEHLEDQKVINCIRIIPTVFGVQLYAAALNRLREWRKFGTGISAQQSDVPVPTLEALYVFEILQAVRQDPAQWARHIVSRPI